MDYLAGKESAIGVVDKKDKSFSLFSKEDLSYLKFCDATFSLLNPDEKVMLKNKFLTPEIVAIMKDKELIDCINAFFKNNLNISETSRNAFLHRNTLLYRIEKVNKLTGLNIRSFEDAMSFKILAVIYEKLNKGSSK